MLILHAFLFVCASLSLRTEASLQAPEELKEVKKSPQIHTDNIVCFTLPKSGTHLLIKLLNLFKCGVSLGYKKPPFPDPIARERYRLHNRFNPPHHYKGMFYVPAVGTLPKKLSMNIVRPGRHLLWSHWPYTKDAEAFLQDKTIGNFFLIRDPRDLIVSMAHMIQYDLEKTQQADLNDLMFDLIDGRKKNFIRWGVEVQETYPLMWEGGIVKFYELYLQWMHAKKFMTVRFEDIVGSKGGGSDEAQFKTIKKMAEHIKVKLSDAEVKQIGKELFGGSGTFREGQIGSWKKYFTPEMIKAFKNTPGACDLLIALGYEANKNW